MTLTFQQGRKVSRNRLTYASETARNATILDLDKDHKFSLTHVNGDNIKVNYINMGRSSA